MGFNSNQLSSAEIEAKKREEEKGKMDKERQEEEKAEEAAKDQGEAFYYFERRKERDNSTIGLCDECEEEMNGGGNLIFCEYCPAQDSEKAGGKWYHANCQDLDRDEYKKYVKDKRAPAGYRVFKCKKCVENNIDKLAVIGELEGAGPTTEEPRSIVTYSGESYVYMVPHGEEE